MLRKTLKLIGIVLISSSLFTSCYTYTTAVGNGAQSTQEITKWNHYFIFGLAPGDVSNPAELAGGVRDYTVETKISFLNGLVGGLTFGIYTPTTTVIRK